MAVSPQVPGHWPLSIGEEGCTEQAALPSRSAHCSFCHGAWRISGEDEEKRRGRKAPSLSSFGHSLGRRQNGRVSVVFQKPPQTPSAPVLPIRYRLGSRGGKGLAAAAGPPRGFLSLVPTTFVQRCSCTGEVPGPGCGPQHQALRWEPAQSELPAAHGAGNEGEAAGQPERGSVVAKPAQSQQSNFTACCFGVHQPSAFLARPPEPSWCLLGAWAGN